MESTSKTYTHNPTLLAIKEQALKEADELLNGSSWRVKKEKNGLKQQVRNQNWSDLKVRGCEAEICGDFNDVYRFLTEPELFISGYKSVGKTCEEGKVLEYVDKDCVVIYELHKPPFPVSKREVVTIRCFKDLGNGQKLSIVKSIDYEACPESDTTVRSFCHFLVYHIEEKSDGKMYIRSCGSTDPKGSIPDFLKNMAEKEHYERVKLLEKILKHLKEENLLSH
mmetsp:Transcript_57105/g.65119  ORF Transcript_57105/g.65119 Transcript_57105/m.65119 type:complete len:224 (-) Transcript_57105:200-871(-)